MSTSQSHAAAGHRPERPRVQILDVLRGVAILGIFFVNIPIMVDPVQAVGPGGAASKAGPALGGAIGLLVEGTQRGLLQMLFGAGMVLLTAKAARPDGPVSVADDYFRRNLWLLAIGLVHVFVVGWAYDVVHVYAITALFLFPFRLLRPATALLLGLSFAALTLGGIIGGFGNAPGPDLVATPASGGLVRDHAVAMWLAAYQGSGLWTCVLESLCTMLVGVAFFQWGITQGDRSRGFYLKVAVVAYAIGCTVRLLLQPGMGHGSPRRWDCDEVGRLSMTVGHIAAINLAWQGAAGRWLLRPFTAAGRTALSLYFLQSIVGLWVFAALPEIVRTAGRDHLVATAAVVVSVQLLTANLWIRSFAIGPIEWAWHRLVDLSRPSPPMGADAGSKLRVATNRGVRNANVRWW